MAAGSGNYGMAITVDNSKTYICLNGGSAIDGSMRSYYVFRINQNGSGQLKGTEIFRTGLTSEGRCRLHKSGTAIIAVAEAKDPTDATKTSLMLVSLHQGSMSMTSAKAKDGAGSEDFNMDSVLDASGNIYASS